jgi:membrane protease YdiL (CAAX protease family)
MNDASIEVASPETHAPGEDRRLVAPLWHTAALVAVLLALAAYGAYAQRHAPGGPELVERSGSAVPLYLGLILAQWALLRFVTAAGLRKTGTRLRDLIGRRWASWKDVARDVAIALVVWAGWGLVEWGVSQRLGADSAKELTALLPHDPLEIAVWIALSLTAGFCEESIFRGYLQTQFRALTGSTALAVILQAVVFGVSHGYQGLRNVIAITVFGALFGALAAWRRSLMPGMILHAWTDIFSGIFARR